jgi:hypothetical protein
MISKEINNHCNTTNKLNSPSCRLSLSCTATARNTGLDPVGTDGALYEVDEEAL